MVPNQSKLTEMVEEDDSLVLDPTGLRRSYNQKEAGDDQSNQVDEDSPIILST